MQQYIAAVICAIAVSAIIMFAVFKRLKLYNFRILAVIALSSLFTALLLPALFHAASYAQNEAPGFSALLPVLGITAALYLIVVILLSIIISRIVTGSGLRKKVLVSQTAGGSGSEVGGGSGQLSGNPAGENHLAQIFDSFSGNTSPSGDGSPSEDNSSSENGISSENTSPSGNDNSSGNKGGKSANNLENGNGTENYLEKSVDSGKIIDKMGIENNVRDSGAMTISDCIEEAFRLKEQGDFEGAIIYFMYALDKKPGNELTLWIVIDICALYKSIGRYDQAHEILDSYRDALVDIMDDAVMEEIESNLVAARSFAD